MGSSVIPSYRLHVYLGSYDKLMHQNQKTIDLLQKFIAIHGIKFDYTKVDFIDWHTKVTIICPIHGEFYQTPAIHRRGSQCPSCGQQSKGLSRRTTVAVAKARVIEIFGDTYDLSLFEYQHVRMPIRLICRHHGVFQTSFARLMQHRGCPICGRSSVYQKGISDPYEILRTIHNDKYTYPIDNYITSKSKITIVCPKHGPFSQEYTSHRLGHGCPQCTHRVSKPSQQWLDSLGIPDDIEHREVYGLIPNRRYIVDGYDPISNTVYEFHGDYWHGNPQKYAPDDINQIMSTPYGKLYEETRHRRTQFMNAGYQYIEIWESDWISS